MIAVAERPVRFAAAVVAAGIGLWQLGGAAYMQAKAVVAQVLLDRAWDRVLAGDTGARPWPWADVSPVATVRVPRLDETAIVLSNVSGEALAFGPGMLRTQIGGEGVQARTVPGLRVVAGHRDTHFAFLEHVQPGDRVELTTSDGTATAYEITGGTVVDGRTFRMPDNAPDGLALVTCWPFGALERGHDRFILWAAPIPAPADSTVAVTDAGPEIAHEVRGAAREI